MIFGSTNQLFFPHITVWGSCFSLGSRRGSRLLRPPSLTSQSHHNSSQLHSSQLHSSLLLTPYFSHPHFSHLTHHILTSHTSLITAPLLTPHLSHHMPFSHLTWHSWPAAASRVAGAVHLSPHNSSQLHFSHLTYHISHLTPQLSRLTQHFSLTIVTAHVKHHYITSHISLITAARSRVAGAVHRASWWSCGARGRRWPAAAFCVANAVHRASWRSCGARGRRWPHSSQQKRKEFPGREQGARTRSNGRRSEFESSFYSTTAPCPNRLRPWDAEWQNGGFMGLLQLLEQWLVKPGKMANCSPSRSTTPTRFTKWKNIWCESKWWRLNLRGISWKELACCMSSPGVRYIRASHVGLSGPFIPISIININMND